MSYTALNTLTYLTKIISKGRIVPPDADIAEYWTCKEHIKPIPLSIQFFLNKLFLYGDRSVILTYSLIRQAPQWQITLVYACRAQRRTLLDTRETCGRGERQLERH